MKVDLQSVTMCTLCDVAKYLSNVSSFIIIRKKNICNRSTTFGKKTKYNSVIKLYLYCCPVSQLSLLQGILQGGRGWPTPCIKNYNKMQKSYHGYPWIKGIFWWFKKIFFGAFGPARKFSNGTHGCSFKNTDFRGAFLPRLVNLCTPMF